MDKSREKREVDRKREKEITNCTVQPSFSVSYHRRQLPVAVDLQKGQ